ncbi:MAG: FixH family protein [Pseudomonadota bacterium]
MSAQRKGRFTGKHMVWIMVGGFGVVAAVNFYMASLAVGGFHGIVVENSYVASQKFNEWIDEADRMEALGWEARATRSEDGHILIGTLGLPDSAVLTAELRRPIGTKQFADLTFAPLGNGQFRSLEPVGDGRWTIRLTIEANGENWAQESALP